MNLFPILSTHGSRIANLQQKPPKVIAYFDWHSQRLDLYRASIFVISSSKRPELINRYLPDSTGSKSTRSWFFNYGNSRVHRFYCNYI